MHHQARLRQTSLCLLACGTLYYAVATGAEAAPQGINEILETLLKQQAAAFDAIKSVHAEYTYRVDGTVEDVQDPLGNVAISGGREIRSGAIKLWLQGENKREHHEYQREYPERGAVMRETIEHVYTPNRYLSHTESTCQVSLYHLDPQRDLAPSMALQRDTIPWKNLFEYGFLPGKSQPLLQYYRDRGKEQVKWVLSGGNDEPYKIVVRVANNGTFWNRRELEVNQHGGFLITSNKLYNEQGHLLYEVAVEPHQVTPQIWVPGNVREWSEVNAWTIDMALKNITINENIPEDQFTLEAMRFDPETTRLIEYASETSDGVVKAFYGGAWIPEKQWPEEVKLRLQSRPRHIAQGGGYNGIWIKGNATK